MTLIAALTVPVQPAWAAGQCTSKKENSAQACSKEKEQAIAAKLQAAEQAVVDAKAPGLGGAGTGPADRAEKAQLLLTQVKAENHDYQTQCNQAWRNCSQICQQEAAQPMNPNAAQAAQDQQTCEKEHKKQDEKAQQNDQSMAQMLQALAGLLAALMGQQKPTDQQQPTCVANPNDPSCKTDTASTVGSSDFANGTFRTGKDASFSDGTLAASDGPAMGTPAQAQMSGALPGGAAGGGMGGLGPMSPSSSSSSGKKDEDSGAPKINLASSGGGGGRAGGGSDFGGGARAASAGVNPGKVTGSEDPRLQSAVDKALQHRAVASDGPLGGISAAHSLDNFQKVEKRMQFERNQLNEH